MHYTSTTVKKPLPLVVVLVGTEYEMNLGMCARTCKNFSVIDLRLVNTQCKVGFDAHKFAKHSEEVLESAKKKIYASVKEATSDCNVVIGTTGVLKRFTNRMKNPIELKQAPSYASGRTAIVFGSEGIGLTEKDLESCDVVTTIPTDDAQPIMNLSHSVAVVLYEFSTQLKNKRNAYYELADTRKVNALNAMFSNIVNNSAVLKNGPKLKDTSKAKLAFKRITTRSKIGENEIQTLFAIFNKLNKHLNQAKVKK